jgi:hypothetical protein
MREGLTPLFGGDFVIGVALAQLDEDAPPPEHHAVPAQSPASNGRPVLDHQNLLRRAFRLFLENASE